ncbi:hydantoinase/oxoprolinase family protein [Desulfosediminicola sp.]|uniref:hydantoinase/oxoprolinase family protein n=1 Tax=Desulfosediminicola sp. TaxID=2886825 RepID=UPI003AF234E5
MIIGLDAGGTHTDAVLLGAEGILHKVKVPTDSEHLFDTVMAALDTLMADRDKAEVARIVLSTTLATNMVVQNRLPEVGVLVAGGPGLNPECFRVGEEYHVVSGALDHRGREIEPLDELELASIGRELQAKKIRCAGVVSKFSVRNPAHELRMVEILTPYVETIFMGHTFSGALSFPRRINTTYLNAAVYPIHKNFFEAVNRSLKAQGLSVPIRILKPDGGTMDIKSSQGYPAQTILSGPSASVMGALASADSEKTSLVLDVGGTTTDMAILLGNSPIIAPHGIELGQHKTLIRALHTESIGVGGDSVVRIAEGEIVIGPDRQGVAMAFGGPVVTTTDALAVLGQLDAGDKDLAKAGVAGLAEQLGLTTHEMAGKIFDTACRRILLAAAEMIETINSRPVYTVHEMYEGLKVQPDQILVLGGPAKQFAARLDVIETELEYGAAIPVPVWQVANAKGCALARTTCEVTVYADTARRVLTAQGEEFQHSLSATATLEDVLEIATDLVKVKAIRQGANPEYLQIEITEQSEFNMVRGFHTTGKNIRVRAQVKPGLIHGYDCETGQLNRPDL